VLKQSYKNIEIIITDDCSNDGTKEIIEKYANKYKKIKPIFSKENTGIQHNFNRGLKKVRGKYFAHIDGDDLMFPNKIKRQVDYLNNNEDVLICAHDMQVFDSSTNKNVGLFSEVVGGKKITGKVGVEFLFDPLVLLSPSSMMYRKNILPHEGFEKRFSYANDFLFHIKILVNGKLGYINETLGLYRKHEGNVTRNANAKKVWSKEILEILSLADSKWPQLRVLIERKRELVYFSEVIRYLNNGENDDAKKMAKKLISEKCYIRGIFAYGLSIISNKKFMKMIYNFKYSRKIWNEFLGH
jgi:glycosyltransferase involved in cell wall biosynthesis